MSAAEIIDFQLDMFETPRERQLRMQLERVEALCHKTKDSTDRVRKKLFAENGEMRKIVSDLSHRLDFIEKAICQNA